MQAGRTLKYLGVTLDPRRTYTVHLREASARAWKSAMAVARLMPNLGGSGAKKRRLLTTVAETRLICAALVWAQQTTQYAVNRRAMVRSQRSVALRVARTYKTVSREATLLLADMVPGHLLATERAGLQRLRGRGLENNEVEERKQDSDGPLLRPGRQSGRRTWVVRNRRKGSSRTLIAG